MFSRDKWLEIISNMVNNPLRTFLTGVSVGVGIFILVFLLGLGQGLEKGAKSSMMDEAVNSIWVRSGRTSKPFAGYQANREIVYSDLDRQNVESDFEEIPTTSAMIRFWGGTVKWKNQQANYGIRAVHPSYAETEQVSPKLGRFLNQNDIRLGAKVAIIGQTVVDEIFKKANPIGEMIQLRGVMFLVVGTFEKPNGRWENRQIYVPHSTGKQLFQGGRNDIDMFVASSGESDYEQSVDISTSIDQILRAKYKVAPEDTRGVRVRNNNEEFKTFADIFKGIKVFVIVMGFFTLLAGIIGVANIMSIAVKERTREIGVRKALGATPWSVLSLILQESIFLTLISGCLGFMAGVGVMELVAANVEHEFFKDPRINFNACIIALSMLIVSGAISGLIPAIRAASIRPIEALRDE